MPIPVVQLAISLLIGLGAMIPVASAPSEQDSSGQHLELGIAYGNTLHGMDDQALTEALADASEVGVTWVRADLSWADVQRDGPDKYDWAPFDRLVAAATRKQLKVLPILAYTPPWATADGCQGDKCAPRDFARFAQFTAEAVTRYSGYGMDTWEIWNEPNTKSFWQPHPSSIEYTRLFSLTRTAILKVKPNATLLLGGLAAVATDANNISHVDFLAGFCKAGGNSLVQGVAYHPYTYPYLPSYRASWQTPWNEIDDPSNSLRAVLRRYGTPDIPIWLTEYGAPTGGPGKASDGSLQSISPATTHVTEKRQGEIAADAVRTARANRHIRALVWFASRDTGTNTATRENFYGLRRADGSAKPAFGSFRDAVRHVR